MVVIIAALAMLGLAAVCYIVVLAIIAIFGGLE